MPTRLDIRWLPGPPQPQRPRPVAQMSTPLETVVAVLEPLPIPERLVAVRVALEMVAPEMQDVGLAAGVPAARWLEVWPQVLAALDPARTVPFFENPTSAQRWEAAQNCWQQLSRVLDEVRTGYDDDLRELCERVALGRVALGDNAADLLGTIHALVRRAPSQFVEDYAVIVYDAAGVATWWAGVPPLRSDVDVLTADQERAMHAAAMRQAFVEEWRKRVHQRLAWVPRVEGQTLSGHANAGARKRPAYSEIVEALRPRRVVVLPTILQVSLPSPEEVPTLALPRGQVAPRDYAIVRQLKLEDPVAVVFAYFKLLDLLADQLLPETPAGFEFVFGHGDWWPPLVPPSAEAVAEFQRLFHAYTAERREDLKPDRPQLETNTEPALENFFADQRLVGALQAIWFRELMRWSVIPSGHLFGSPRSQARPDHVLNRVAHGMIRMTRWIAQAWPTFAPQAFRWVWFQWRKRLPYHIERPTVDGRLASVRSCMDSPPHGVGSLTAPGSPGTEVPAQWRGTYRRIQRALRPQAETINIPEQLHPHARSRIRLPDDFRSYRDWKVWFRDRIERQHWSVQALRACVIAYARRVVDFLAVRAAQVEDDIFYFTRSLADSMARYDESMHPPVAEVRRFVTEAELVLRHLERPDLFPRRSVLRRWRGAFAPELRLGALENVRNALLDLDPARRWPSDAEQLAEAMVGLTFSLPYRIGRALVTEVFATCRARSAFVQPRRINSSSLARA